ncbi:hypothetical protein KKA47_02700 [bacterium]|nr:hypothetical protein [bacterium]
MSDPIGKVNDTMRQITNNISKRRDEHRSSDQKAEQESLQKLNAQTKVEGNASTKQPTQTHQTQKNVAEKQLPKQSTEVKHAQDKAKLSQGEKNAVLGKGKAQEFSELASKGSAAYEMAKKIIQNNEFLSNAAVKPENQTKTADPKATQPAVVQKGAEDTSKLKVKNSKAFKEPVEDKKSKKRATDTKETLKTSKPKEEVKEKKVGAQLVATGEGAKEKVKEESKTKDDLAIRDPNLVSKGKAKTLTDMAVKGVTSAIDEEEEETAVSTKADSIDTEIEKPIERAGTKVYVEHDEARDNNRALAQIHSKEVIQQVNEKLDYEIKRAEPWILALSERVKDPEFAKELLIKSLGNVYGLGIK